MTSLFKGEFEIKLSYAFTGLTLQYKSNSFRKRNKPCSGRTFALGLLSYFGSPIAPNKIASAFLHISIVSSGKGSPETSIAQAPNCASLYKKI